jgi:hypothetical protein
MRAGVERGENGRLLAVALGAGAVGGGRRGYCRQGYTSESNKIGAHSIILS